MLKEMEVRQADNSDRKNIIGLLQSEKLPSDDLPQTLEHFFIAVDEDNVIGAVGLEQYDNCGLLRSLVVNPAYRNQNIAGKLVGKLEIRAKESGIDCIYLLTETAHIYFEKKGYKRITREEVPDSIRQSSEFSHVCPSSAIVMMKTIS